MKYLISLELDIDFKELGIVETKSSFNVLRITNIFN